MFVTKKCIDFLKEQKKFDSIVLTSMGKAVSKVVSIAEIVKREVPGLYQITETNSVEVEDEYHPVEEGLKIVTEKRRLVTLTITLSKKPLDSKNPGFQSPLPVEQAKVLGEVSADAQEAKKKRRNKPKKPKQPQDATEDVKEEPATATATATPVVAKESAAAEESEDAAELSGNRGRGRGRGRGFRRGRGRGRGRGSFNNNNSYAPREDNAESSEARRGRGGRGRGSRGGNRGGASSSSNTEN